MNDLIKVKDYDGVARDAISRAIVATDKDSFESFRQRRLKEKEKDIRLQQLEEKMNRMESLLEILVEKLK